MVQVVTAAMKLQDTCSLEEKLWQTRQCIKKQRHFFADKDDILEELKQIDVAHLTPIEALNTLYSLQNLFRMQYLIVTSNP